MRLLPVLGDQLSHDLASLAQGPGPDRIVVMAEVANEGRYVPHHKHKLVLVLSAMRHFAQELRGRGWQVDYQRLDDADAADSLDAAIAAAARRHGATSIQMVEAGEHRVRALQAGLASRAGAAVTLLPDDRFLVREADFASWRAGRRRLRLDDFYRWQREARGLLMAGGRPLGGKFSLDAENRKPWNPTLRPPPPPAFAPDAITRDVITLVAAHFPESFGRLEGFDWPVTRAQALDALADFVAHRLPLFGDYQDAMAQGEETLYHSRLAAALNIGLLKPDEMIDAAIAAHADGAAPLNAVEGFVRQILGWREYVRGIYFTEGPAYLQRNALGATRPLPDIYWQGESGMACFDAAFGQTWRSAYAHHIQRLMVLGNFALLAGVDPHQLHLWFLAVYADAFEWVEAPNVIGMSQYADGGLMASKPYAAGAAYINRMGNHCRACRYDPAGRPGRPPCPFIALYWDFIARNERRLAGNPRMVNALSGWRRMAPARQHELRQRAEGFLGAL
jgi:deoxyribodipyrimidine photolyase-related protein